jgi:hypothetical protein
MCPQLLTGVEFNKRYRSKQKGETYEFSQFIKLTNELEVHNGYEFKTGLNIDTVPFDPQHRCDAGGLYFTLLNDLSHWLHYNDKTMFYVRSVTIPDDAQVLVEKDKCKADRLILGDRIPIDDLDVWSDTAYCLQAVKLNGWALQYVKNQTKEICLAACKQNGWTLQHVNDSLLTEEMCLEACKLDGHALQHVKQSLQTPEMCIAAIKKTGAAMQYVKVNIAKEFYNEFRVRYDFREKCWIEEVERYY